MTRSQLPHNNFLITNRTRKTIPRFPFRSIKEKILGKKFETSIVFVDSRESKKLNKKYRGKNKPANVLTFPLGKNSGEIFIDYAEVKKSAPHFSFSPRKMLGLVFIHALLHLKGIRHGSTMEKEEGVLLRRLYR